MKKTRKPTVTIGIPAYNEERNIERLLTSISIQKETNFKLERILIMNDASVDKTALIVKKFIKKNNKVKLVDGKHRIGKAMRLNQLYRFNTSSILVTIDADTILGTDCELAKLITQFNINPQLLVCTLRHVPLPQKKIIGKISNSSFLLWQEAAKMFNEGNNIHTILGSAVAIKKEMVKSIIYPKRLIADQGYLYIKTVQKSKSAYKYLDNSKVYLKTVSTLQDYLSQGSRAVHTDKKDIADIFGENALSYYKIPFKYKIAAIFKRFCSDPLFTFSAISLALYIHLFTTYAKNKGGLWKIAVSSK